jgi:ferrous iron transport protein B
MEAALAAVEAAKSGKPSLQHIFSGAVEHALAHIEEAILHALPEEQQRWYAVKIFERDRQVLEQLQLDEALLAHIEADIVDAETEMDDDAEGVITNDRYLYVERVIQRCARRKKAGTLTMSDKIDRVLTNRFAALPIFAAIMFLVYYLSVSTVGTWVTDWANDGVFGDGWHLLNIGAAEYGAAAEEYSAAAEVIDQFVLYAEKKGIDVSAYGAADGPEALKDALVAIDSHIADAEIIRWEYTDEASFATAAATATGADFTAAIETAYRYSYADPAPAAYGEPSIGKAGKYARAWGRALPLPLCGGGCRGLWRKAAYWGYRFATPFA